MTEVGREIMLIAIEQDARAKEVEVQKWLDKGYKLEELQLDIFGEPEIVHEGMSSYFRMPPFEVRLKDKANGAQ